MSNDDKLYNLNKNTMSKIYTEIQVRELLLKVREYQATVISMHGSQPHTDEEVTRMINDGINNAVDHAEEWLNALRQS